MPLMVVNMFCLKCTLLRPQILFPNGPIAKKMDVGKRTSKNLSCFVDKIEKKLKPGSVDIYIFIC
jgi:hypothetical protein